MLTIAEAEELGRAGRGEEVARLIDAAVSVEELESVRLAICAFDGAGAMALRKSYAVRSRELRHRAAVAALDAMRAAAHEPPPGSDECSGTQLVVAW